MILEKETALFNDGAIAALEELANGKSTVFYQASAPAVAGRKVNDIWFDTDDGNTMYRFNGTTWAKQQFGDAAIVAGSITAAKINTQDLYTNFLVTNILNAAQASISSLSAITADIGEVTAGVLKSANYSAPTSATGDYSTAGMLIDLTNGIIRTKNFAVLADGSAHINTSLTLGGANNASGVLTVKDATGATIGTWDKDGINTNAGVIAGWTVSSNKLSATGIELYSSYSSTNGNLRITRGNIYIYENLDEGYLVGLQPVIHGNYSYGTITIAGTTEGMTQYSSRNPKIIFSNKGSTNQALALIFNDYDSVQAPASLTLAGNQGGEYFIAPNIKVTDGLEVGTAKFYTPSEVTATKSGSYITGGSITVRRRGNVAHIYGNITIGSAVASQTTIATIPDGYRPITTDFFAATNGSFFRVNSNGTIQAQNALTAGNYYFSTTYPLT